MCPGGSGVTRVREVKRRLFFLDGIEPTTAYYFSQPLGVAWTIIRNRCELTKRVNKMTSTFFPGVGFKKTGSVLKQWGLEKPAQRRTLLWRLA